MELIKYDAFISYKRKDGGVWAELIYQVLTYKHQLKVFMDVHSNIGGDWSPQLANAILESRVIIMVLTPQMGDNLRGKNDVFIKEIRRANRIKKTIIPFLIENCTYESFLHSENLPSIIIKTIKKKHCMPTYQHELSEKILDTLKDYLNPKLELIIECEEEGFIQYKIETDEDHLVSVKEDTSLTRQMIITLDRLFHGVVTITLTSNKDKMSRTIRQYVNSILMTRDEKNPKVYAVGDANSWNPDKNDETLSYVVIQNWDKWRREEQSYHEMQQNWDKMNGKNTIMAQNPNIGEILGNLKADNLI